LQNKWKKRRKNSNKVLNWIRLIKVSRRYKVTA